MDATLRVQGSGACAALEDAPRFTEPASAADARLRVADDPELGEEAAVSPGEPVCGPLTER
jgi:hypothetical protein